MGPQRLRRRRQLQRGRRLHRPFPDRPLRRRPGRRRPVQGEDAIWSHRWKAFQNTGQGPADNKDGGTPVGNTGLWVADYTIQPENGGLSVFAHEYGHDLGLPDDYDTAGGPDNAVSWWTLMAQSRASAAGDEGIGTRPADLGAWDKLQLGWFDYEIVPAGTTRTLDLGPHEYNSAKAQGVATPLHLERPVVTDNGAPFAGSNQWYSGHRRRHRPLALAAGDAARWHRDPDVPGHAGTSRTAVPTRVTTRSWRSTTVSGVDRDPGFDRQGRGGQRDRRLEARGWEASDVRPDEVRREDDRAPAGVTGTDGAAQGNPDLTELSRQASSPTRSRSPPAPPRCSRTVPRAATTAGRRTGFQHRSARATTNALTTMTTSPVFSNRQYVSYDKYLQTGPYNYSGG